VAQKRRDIFEKILLFIAAISFIEFCKLHLSLDIFEIKIKLINKKMCKLIYSTPQTEELFSMNVCSFP
jgi:hypothetical protein